MSSLRPLEPFQDWPVDLFIEGAGFAWYRRDLGAFITQSTLLKATAESSDLVNDYLDHILENERSHVAAMGGLLVFYDWRSIRGIEPAAATRFMQRLARRERGYLRKSIVVFSPTSNALLETALRAASAFAAVAIGRHILIGNDIHASLAEAGIRSSPKPSELRSLRPVVRTSDEPPQPARVRTPA